MILFSASSKPEPQSPEWWVQKLYSAMQRRNRSTEWNMDQVSNKAGTRPPLELLDAWRRNEPPLPTSSREWAETWRHILRITRTNAAELIVSSRSERIVPLGWTTTVDADADGDQVAESIARRNDLRTRVTEAIEDMLALGEGYLLVGPDLDGDGKALITRESPLTTFVAKDAAGRPRRGLRTAKDEWTGEDDLVLYAPGYVAFARKNPGTGFYEWDEDRGGSFPGGARTFPLVPLTNKDGVGEFERHLGDCQRINDSLFNRLVLTKLQAHRQRALERPVPKLDEVDMEVELDTSDFSTGPNALWDLPPGMKVWESAAAELGPVRSIVEDDFKILAGATKTPVWVMLPGNQNQSATGSENAESAFLSLVADRQHRADVALSQVMALAFDVAGDRERAHAESIRTLWAPQERYSLNDKSQAIRDLWGKVPADRLMLDVWQARPEELPKLRQQRGADMLFNARPSTSTA